MAAFVIVLNDVGRGGRVLRDAKGPAHAGPECLKNLARPAGFEPTTPWFVGASKCLNSNPSQSCPLHQLCSTAVYGVHKCLAEVLRSTANRGSNFLAGSGDRGAPSAVTAHSHEDFGLESSRRKGGFHACAQIIAHAGGARPVEIT